MNKIYLITLLTLSGNFCFGQLPLKDKDIISTSDPIYLGFTKSETFSSAAVAAVQLKSNQKAIEFFFTTNPKFKAVGIASSQVRIKCSNGEVLILDSPIKDSVMFIKSGALSISVILYLDNLKIDILKQSPPIEITVDPFKKDIELQITRKSGKKFQQFISENF